MTSPSHYSSQSPSASPSSDTPEDFMLSEIRNMLINNLNSKQINTPITNSQAHRYLTESFKLVGGQEHNKNNERLIKSKVSEASKLLEGETNMIRSYVRDKIESEVFGGKQFEGEFYDRLIETRDDLEKKILEEKIEEEKNIDKMIDQTRRYKNYETKSTVPLLQIESLLHREQVDYDKIVKEERSLKSESYNIPESEYFDKHEFQNSWNGTKDKGTKNWGMIDSKIKKGFGGLMEELIFEVKGEDEDEGIFEGKAGEVVSEGFEKILEKSERFVAVFKVFLEKQIKRVETDEKITEEEQSILQNSQRPKKRYTFANKLSNDKIKEEQNFELKELSKLFRFKPFLPSKYELTESHEIIKRVISKKIGETKKFHTKLCILENNMLYYTDENEKVDEVNKSNMKSIELAVAPIEIVPEKKEEGNLFQSKEQEIMLVTVKGLNRNFLFELNFGEGNKLVEDINHFNLKRLHHMSCLLSSKPNQNMEKLIDYDNNVLDLSGQYIRPEEEYPNKWYRSCFMGLIVGILGKRKNIEILELSKSKLSFSEISLLSKECDKNMELLKELNISHTKLDKESLKSILSLINKAETHSPILLNLSYCQISNSILQFVAPLLGTLVCKIGVMNLEGNEITQEGLQYLQPSVSSKISCIKTLILNNCPIENLNILCGFVGVGKLETLCANSCRITIANLDTVEKLINASKEGGTFRRLELRKNVFHGNLTWLEDMGPYLELKIDVSVKNMSAGALESKYLKIQMLNEK